MTLNRTAKSWVATHRETSAAAFIDILSPVSGVLSGPGGLPHGKLYRGIGDASYALMPAAFRSDANLFQLPHLSRGPGNTNGVQIEREFQTLSAFIRAAGRQGHHIPEDSQELRAEMKSLGDHLSTDQKIKEWPPLSLLSVLALAQHYGVPTRLLDWSLDPYVAAYFAANAAARRSQDMGDLAVWGVVANLFDVNRIMLMDDAKFERLPIQYVETPWAGNDNAKAQRAVFLAYRQFDIDPSARFEFRPYDELLEQNLDDSLRGSPAAYCLTLPKQEAPELLRLLAFQGYDGATMFPGLRALLRACSRAIFGLQSPARIPAHPKTRLFAIN